MQPAREGLLKIVADALRRAPAEQAPLLAWPLVCGARVAERTEATSFQDGVLNINVPDETWRAQLQSMAPQYLAGLERMIGKHVERVEFVAISGKRRR
ncbi:MAG TPA: DUF721 domain-containing protein [Terriglobales bacterium]|nr:DUF721 domain-containing protein [Terriglobales bacterium]